MCGIPEYISHDMSVMRGEKIASILIIISHTRTFVESFDCAPSLLDFVPTEYKIYRKILRKGVLPHLTNASDISNRVLCHTKQE